MAELVTEEQKAVKLPYFHRVLSDEEQRLIGDITPKVISATPSAIAATSTSVAETAAWNGAGTWEERDVTKSARIVLEEAFSSSFEVAKDGGYVALFEPAENVKGHASITHVRGTPRFMYEWSFDLQFQVTNNSGDGGPYAGKVTVDDVVNDQVSECHVDWLGTHGTPVLMFVVTTSWTTLNWPSRGSASRRRGLTSKPSSRY